MEFSGQTIVAGLTMGVASAPALPGRQRALGDGIELEVGSPRIGWTVNVVIPSGETRCLSAVTVSVSDLVTLNENIVLHCHFRFTYLQALSSPVRRTLCTPESIIN